MAFENMMQCERFPFLQLYSFLVSHSAWRSSTSLTVRISVHRVCHDNFSFLYIDIYQMKKHELQPTTHCNTKQISPKLQFVNVTC